MVLEVGRRPDGVVEATMRLSARSVCEAESRMCLPSTGLNRVGERYNLDTYSDDPKHTLPKCGRLRGSTKSLDVINTPRLQISIAKLVRLELRGDRSVVVGLLVGRRILLIEVDVGHISKGCCPACEGFAVGESARSGDRVAPSRQREKASLS